MRKAYFHEDDYCQIELIPFENELFVKQEIEQINLFSDFHKAENGYGWTDVYMRSESKIQLIDYRIKRNDLQNILNKIEKKFDKVITGYSSHEEKCKNTIAYGINHVKIFFSYEKKYIKNIWFTLILDNEENIDRLFNILKAISNSYDLIYVDWQLGYNSRIKCDSNLKENLIKYYLNGNDIDSH